MKIINSVLLYLVSVILVAGIIVAYFKFTQTISQIKMPNLSNISMSDFLKFSRFSLEKAPSESLVGTVTSMSGEVEFESRMATQSAKISTPPTEVQQGESFKTGTDGKISINFENAVKIDVSGESAIGIIQTLPKDLVFSQSSGSIIYEKKGDYPVSIRSLHLLIENNGKIEISLDKVKPTLTVKILNGAITVAYNDTENISRVLDIQSGKSLIFNDRTRRGVAK